MRDKSVFPQCWERMLFESTKDAPAGNRTRGQTMGMFDFTTKPLALGVDV